MLTPGVTLAGRYRLTRRIAVGGMGEVWAADDTRLGRLIAVKILRPEFIGDPEFVGRFRNEARITASLNHPGIAAVYDYGEIDADPDTGPHVTAFLVMEFVHGEALSDVLARLGRLSPGRTLDVVRQTGDALQVAHERSLVHRDVKPGNLLITPTGQVKITDFGIAKVADQAPVTRTGLVMGTAQYISPEQAAGRDALPASDIYSLGVVAYECLAGQLPFDRDSAIATAMAHVGEEPPPLPDDVPRPLAALVMRMLAKDPARRFPDGAALADAAARIGNGAADGVDRSRPRRRPTAVLDPGKRVTGAAAPPDFRPPGPRPDQRAAGRPAPAMAPPPRVVHSTGAVVKARRVPKRRTGVSMALAVVVLALAGIAAVLIDQRVSGSGVEPAWASVGEPTVRTVGEPTVRTVGEPTVGTVGEPTVGTVGEPTVGTVGALGGRLLHDTLGEPPATGTAPGQGPAQ